MNPYLIAGAALLTLAFLFRRKTWKDGQGLAVSLVTTPQGQPAALDDGALWLVVSIGDNGTNGTLWGILTSDGQKRAVETAKLPATTVTFSPDDVKQIFT